MIDFLKIDDDLIIHVTDSSFPDYPAVDYCESKSLLKASFGLLFRIIRNDDRILSTSTVNVYDDANVVVSDPNQVYRLTSGALTAIKVRYLDEDYLLDIHDYEKHLSQKIPETYWLAHNQLTPHLVKIKKVAFIH